MTGRTHFLGIGGVGMAGVAFLLKARNREVSGCDLSATPRTRWLEENGIPVAIGHDAAHITSSVATSATLPAVNVDELIVTPAVPPENPELAAARAAGIDALDTVYSNLNDMETFRNEVETIKKLGFDGKSIINPRQIEVVNEVFAPKEKEIQKSLTILAAIKEAEKKGSGVIAVNGKMVDRPVVLRAQRTIDLAIASGILTKEDIQ